MRGGGLLPARGVCIPCCVCAGAGAGHGVTQWCRGAGQGQGLEVPRHTAGVSVAAVAAARRTLERQGRGQRHAEAAAAAKAKAEGRGGRRELRPGAQAQLQHRHALGRCLGSWASPRWRRCTPWTSSVACSTAQLQGLWRNNSCTPAWRTHGGSSSVGRGGGWDLGAAAAAAAWGHVQRAPWAGAGCAVPPRGSRLGPRRLAGSSGGGGIGGSNNRTAANAVPPQPVPACAQWWRQLSAWPQRAWRRTGGPCSVGPSQSVLLSKVLGARGGQGTGAPGLGGGGGLAGRRLQHGTLDLHRAPGAGAARSGVCPAAGTRLRPGARGLGLGGAKAVHPAPSSTGTVLGCGGWGPGGRAAARPVTALCSHIVGHCSGCSWTVAPASPL